MPAEALVQRIRDSSTWPEWQPEIVSIADGRPLSKGDSTHGGARMLGFQVEGLSTASVVDEHRFEEDVIVGVRMRISYEVTPTETGCVVTHHLSASLPRGVLGSFLSLLLRWRLRRLQTQALQGLEAYESGSAS